MSVVNEIVVRFGAEVAPLQQGVARANQSLDSVATGGRRAATSLGGVTGAASNVAKQATSATSALNTVRGAMTSVAGAALQAAPGVAPLASIIGSMAIGTPMMIGVLAGLSAVALAWDRITRSSRDAEAAQEKALQAAEALARSQADPVAQAMIANTGFVAEQQKVAADLVRARAVLALAKNPPEGADPSAAAAAVAMAQKEVDRLSAEFNRLGAAITTNARAVSGILDEQFERRQRAQDDAARRAETAREKELREEERKHAKLLRMYADWLRKRSDLLVRMNALPSGDIASTAREGVVFPVAPAIGEVKAVASRNKSGRSATNIWQQRRDSVTEGAGAAFGALKSGLGGLLASVTPLGMAFTLVGSVLEPLLPMFQALQMPLKIVGAALAQGLAPVLKAVFPVFKGVAIAATYLGEIFFRVADGIATVIGMILRGVGNLLDSRLGGLFGLRSEGQALKKAGRALEEMFDDSVDGMKDAREGLKDLTWEDALAPLKEATRAAAYNVTEAFNAEHRRFQVTGGGTSVRSPFSAAGTKPQTVTYATFGPGSIVLQAAPGEDPVRFGRKVMEAIRAESMLGGTSDLDLAILGVR